MGVRLRDYAVAVAIALLALMALAHAVWPTPMPLALDAAARSGEAPIACVPTHIDRPKPLEKEGWNPV